MVLPGFTAEKSLCEMHQNYCIAAQPGKIANKLGLLGLNLVLEPAQAGDYCRLVCPIGGNCYYEGCTEPEPIPVLPEYICEKNPYARGCEYLGYRDHYLGEEESRGRRGRRYTPP
jgi:hypothetical protein